MRSTKQRNVILDIINNSYDHLDAYGVYEEARKQIPNISLGTVYRNLKSLENAHLIDIVYDGADKIRYDKKDFHQHFICVNCHKIIDIYDLNFKNISTYKNNVVMNCKIILEGICEECQKEE